MAKVKLASKTKEEKKEKRAYISQEDIPLYTLENSIKIAQALYDNFGNKGASPHQVAIALEISPTSSAWKLLTGSAVAYGLTNGGAQANEVTLTTLGKRIVAPETDNDDVAAKVIACLKPKILKDFFDRYDKNKFPKDVIAKNVIATLGVPKDKVDDAYENILANGKFVGIIQDTKTGLFVFIEKSKLNVNTTNGTSENNEEFDNNESEELPEKLAAKLDLKKSSTTKPLQENINQKTRVFISHGKNKKIVEQLKEILTFGQFEVVISIEKEATAIPVPEKVFTDMRECNAAVIHVESELELMDKEGNVHLSINENVLIEIGAAIALYGKKFVLLCESSLKLPSNLQGLYRCNYDGKELTYDATMKLLKAFNGFRQNKD